MPLSLGLPMEPLAPLDATPLLRKLSSPLVPAVKRVATLGAVRYADLLRAWGAPHVGGVVPDEPFDPSRARVFNAVALSGGECQGTNVVLRLQSACEVLWEGAGDAWQSQPDANSDNDSVGDDIVAGAGYESGRRGRGRERGSRRGRRLGRGSAVNAKSREWDSVAEGAVASTSDASSGNYDDDEKDFVAANSGRMGLDVGVVGECAEAVAPEASRPLAHLSRALPLPVAAATKVTRPITCVDLDPPLLGLLLQHYQPPTASVRGQGSRRLQHDTGYSSHSSDDTRPPVSLALLATHHRRRAMRASIEAALRATGMSLRLLLRRRCPPASLQSRPRRCERVPAEQLPEGWSTATHAADVRRPPEYFWFE